MDGMKRHAKKKKSSIQQSKNAMHIYPENSHRARESQWSSFAYRSHELGTVLLTYASNETKIYKLYIYTGTQEQVAVFTNVAIFPFFYSCSFLQCGRPDFYH